mmetsp:Transcript_34882/g.76124  ORF Transcript_34882/g.76124 Transcript_34882/m.76124 type:complete len:345 (+) Transcript_34882:1083-2117(+)
MPVERGAGRPCRSGRCCGVRGSHHADVRMCRRPALRPRRARLRPAGHRPPLAASIEERHVHMRRKRTQRGQLGHRVWFPPRPAFAAEPVALPLPAALTTGPAFLVANVLAAVAQPQFHAARVGQDARADLATPATHVGRAEVKRRCEFPRCPFLAVSTARVTRPLLTEEAAQPSRQWCTAPSSIQRTMVTVFADPTERNVDPLLKYRLPGVALGHKVYAVLLHPALHRQHVPILEVCLGDGLRIGIHAISPFQCNPELSGSPEGDADDGAVALLALEERLVVGVPAYCLPAIAIKIHIRAVRPRILTKAREKVPEDVCREFLHHFSELFGLAHWLWLTRNGLPG